MPAAGHRQMEPAARTGTSRALPAIVAAGLICGAMDISAAFLLAWFPTHYPPKRLLQGIASGLLGSASFQHGWATAALGLVFHFLIAFTAAAVFYAASRRLAALIDHPWLAGVAYALVVYGFMYWIVIPLSRLHRRPVTLSSSMTAVVIHIICVGLPISLTVHRFTRR